MTARERAEAIAQKLNDCSGPSHSFGYDEKIVEIALGHIEAAVLEERNAWRTACGWKGFLCACRGCKHPANCACDCPICHIESVKEKAVLEERSRCVKAVSLFVQLCQTADLDSEEAERLRDEHEAIAEGYRINDNPLLQPIGKMAHKIEANEREACAKIADRHKTFFPGCGLSDWMDACNEIAHAIRKRA